MFSFPNNQLYSEKLTCQIDRETRRELNRFRDLTGAPNSTSSKLTQIWHRLLLLLGHLFRCIDTSIAREKQTLMDSNERGLQQDLDRMWTLSLNQIRYTSSGDFIHALRSKGLSEEKIYNILIFSYQKVWAIFMESMMGETRDSSLYTAMSSDMRSITWNIQDDGKITMKAQGLFSLMPYREGLEFSAEGERKYVDFTFESNLEKDVLTYEYAEVPWKAIFMQTCASLCHLEGTFPLRDILLALHDINVTWGADIRQQVIELYNQKRGTFQELPSEWNEALLNQSYQVDAKLLHLVFQEVAKTLGEPFRI